MFKLFEDEIIDYMQFVKQKDGKKLIYVNKNEKE